MTIEEIEKQWNGLIEYAKEWAYDDSFSEFEDKYVRKLLAVAKAAKKAWPIALCDTPFTIEHASCRACDLKKAVEELEK